jgi:signal transduction histidine kinase
MKDPRPPVKMRAMNEALLLGSLRQHELTEASARINAKLRKEIAAHKRTEAALRESEGRFRTLFELGPAAIYSCDTQGLIVDYNGRAVELWGRKPLLGDPRDQFCGSFKLFRPAERFLPHRQCPMAKVALGITASVKDAEVVMERPDGSRITVVVNVQPLKNSKGEVTGAINCFYDITERKHEEETLRRLAVLAASNRKLETEIVLRKKTEKILLKSELHQKQLRERAKRLAHQVLHSQEEERLRISRELHDQVVQVLIGINVRLVGLAGETKTPGPRFRKQLIAAQQLVADSVETVHRVSRDLRPTLLDDLGLIPTLHSFLKTFMEETGVRASLSVFAAVEKLDKVLLTVLYRVALEALTNVARHAKARTVDISLRKVAGQVSMTIRDDGEGFKTDAQRPAGKKQRLGLVGMQERLEMIGGTFDIRCVAGKGTTVTCTIPLLQNLLTATRASPAIKKAAPASRL